MFCKHCGKEIEDGSGFCSFCGEPVRPENVPVTEGDFADANPVSATAGGSALVADPVESMRSSCTRIGLAFIAMFAAVYAVKFGISAINSSFAETYSELVSCFALYAVGGSVFWQLVRSMPTSKPGESDLKPTEFARLMLENIAVGYAIIFLCLILISLLGFDSSSTSDSVEGETSLILTIVFSCLIPAMAEETIYRRILYRRLRPMGARFAIVVSAVIFGICHRDLLQGLYATSSGIIYACVTEKTGRIRYSIALHAIFNSIGSVFIANLNLGAIGFLILVPLIVVGVILFKRDLPTLLPEEPSQEGCWHSVLTSPGSLAFVVVFVLLGVCMWLGLI